MSEESVVLSKYIAMTTSILLFYKKLSKYIYIQHHELCLMCWHVVPFID